MLKALVTIAIITTTLATATPMDATLQTPCENIAKDCKQSEQTEQRESLGVFTITAYCPCSQCCGWNTGITASGTQATAGRTIGVDTSLLPFGTVVEIDGLGEYIAEDTGGAIQSNHIDLFMDSHEEALQFGVQEREVFIK